MKQLAYSQPTETEAESVLIQIYVTEAYAFNFYKKLSQEYSIHSVIKWVRGQIIS